MSGDGHDRDAVRHYWAWYALGAVACFALAGHGVATEGLASLLPRDVCPEPGLSCDAMGGGVLVLAGAFFTVQTVASVRLRWG